MDNLVKDLKNSKKNVLFLHVLGNLEPTLREACGEGILIFNSRLDLENHLLGK